VLSSSWDRRPFGLSKYQPKIGGLCPFLREELGPDLTQCGLGEGLSPYQVASLFTSHLAITDMGQKSGSVPLWGELGPPSNTVSPGPRPSSVPSGILIHPAIWPQQTWAKNWGAVPLWGRGSCISIWHNMARADAYLRAKFHLDPCNRLATIH